MIRALAALLLFLVPLPLAAQPVFDRFASDFIETARAEKNVGGSIVLVRDGRIAMRHFGLADIEQNQPADADTIYHWASITKTFTAIALMQLAERRLVDLDASVVTYLPELRQVRNPHGPIDRVTVRHLLNHSSGLRDPTWPWNADGTRERPAWQPHSPASWSQLVAMMPYTSLAFEPGTQYGYSNLGSILIAEIVERISGDDIEAYVDKNILDPLGMSRTYFDITPWHLQRHRSNSYVMRNGRPLAEGREFDTGITTGNGGLNAPVGDMAKYLNFLLGVGDTPLYEQILPRRTLEAMWEPRFRVDYDPTVDERMADHFFTIDHPGADGRPRRYVGHTGSQNGFRSFIYIFPGSRTGLIAVVNTTLPEARRPLIFNTRRAAFERLFPALERRR